MDKKTIQEQFGANAASYATSRVHAKGASLTRLVELVQPQPDWLVLDVASAAGHTAWAFAPHVRHVWSTDITSEMLDLARQQAAERGIENVTVEYADAGDLPYADASFQLVTCRIAPHHFPSVPNFIAEAVRVLAPGGLLAVVDNIVPAGPAGAYVNAFEKLRDPSHGRCLSLDEWITAFHGAGLTLRHQEILDKSMDFNFWAQRHDATMQSYLRAMLTEVAGPAADFLRPQQRGQSMTFHLQEGLIVGQKSPPSL